jgi:hypothetical protein
LRGAIATKRSSVCGVCVRFWAADHAPPEFETLASMSANPSPVEPGMPALAVGSTSASTHRTQAT